MLLRALSAAAGKRRDSPSSRWRRTCSLLVVPYTAVLHHAVFFPGTCLWVPFEAKPDRTTDLRRFVQEDGSLVWSIALAAATYRLGQRRPKLQRLFGPLFTGLLPLSLWIWDIPFSQRAMCRYLHDGKLSIKGSPVRTAHIYSLSAVLYGVLLAVGNRNQS